jgi:hypothetical protein
MITQARVCKEPVGFLDPLLVSAAVIMSDEPYINEYVTKAFLAQKDKDYIMFAYRPR